MVLGGAYTAHSSVLKSSLAKSNLQHERLILLLDPDVVGRQARAVLTASLPEAWHAFVPSHLATASSTVRYVHDCMLCFHLAICMCAYAVTVCLAKEKVV